MAWTNPKLDWISNPHNPIKDDFNRIEGNIDFLKTEIETKKGAIVDALNAVGISASLTDTHAQLSAKIAAAEKTGVVLTPGTADVPIPKGIYDTGGGKVLGDPDLIASNIKQGKNIFGVAGNVIPDYLDEDWFNKTPKTNDNSTTGDIIIWSISGKGILISYVLQEDASLIYIDGVNIGEAVSQNFNGRLLLFPFQSSLQIRKRADYYTTPNIFYILD